MTRNKKSNRTNMHVPLIGNEDRLFWFRLGFGADGVCVTWLRTHGASKRYGHHSEISGGAKHICIYLKSVSVFHQVYFRAPSDHILDRALCLRFAGLPTFGRFSC